MTKLLTCTALLLALATPALAQIGGDSITGNSGVAVNGTVQNSTINNGTTGAGAFSPTSTSTATGGTAIAGGGDARSSANQAQGQTQSATSGVSGSGNSSVSIKDRRQAPAVFAPGLVAGFDCMGSGSVGGSGPGFGLSFGSTTVNEDCINVYLSRELERKGDREGSWGVLCESPKVRKHSSKCPVRDEDVETVERNEYPSVQHASPARH